MERKNILVCRAVKQSLPSLLLFLLLATVFAVPVTAQTTATVTPINYGAAVGILQAGDGNFYAPSAPFFVSCPKDSTSICSFIYKMTPDGTVSVLYAFNPMPSGSATNKDGIAPTALIVGTDGNLYGTCQWGGPGTGGGGTIFKIDPTLNPPNNFTLLKSFGYGGQVADPGVGPLGLIQGSDGNLYFFNSNGVYELTLGPNGGAVSAVFTFPVVNQMFPQGTSPTSMVQGADGNFYLTLGTGAQAAPNTSLEGAIAQLTPGGSLLVIRNLHDGGSEGHHPLGPLTQGPDGTLYGVTLNSGANNSGPGLVFGVTTNGVYTVLHQGDAAKVGGRNGALFLASDGNLYGTTLIGGDTASVNCKPLGCGSFYQLTTSGNYTDLHDFEGGTINTQNPPLPPPIDGAGPTTPLVQTDGGYFYGTQLGGQNGVPIVYKAALTPAIPSPIQLSFDPSPAIPGEPTTLTWKVLNAFSLTAQQCSASIVGNPSGAGTWTGPQTGTLTGGVYSGSAQIIPTANGLFTYALTCGGKESGFFALTVNKDGAVKIVNTTLPQGTVGEPYDELVTAVGGFTPYDWSIVDGQLPPGVAFGLSGDDVTLIGVPTQWGSYPVTFKVVDHSKPPEDDPRSLTIVVKSGLTLVQNLQNPNFNGPYSQSLAPDTTGGIQPYTWKLAGGKLPTGLVLNSSTGLVSGKATEAGSFTFTITVTDSEDTPDQIQVTFTLKVAGPLQIVTASPLPPAAVGVPYAIAPLAASGGTLPYKWSLGQNAPGSVPAGLALAEDGTLSGIPSQYSTATNGLNEFNVQVTDSSNPPLQPVPTTFAIAVKKTLKAETTTLPNGTLGVVTDVPLVASGGIPPYAWTAAVLPNPNIGVQVVNGNTLEYNPTVAGNSVVTLTVQDSERMPDSAQVNASLIILPLQLATTTTLTSSNTTAGTGQSIVFTAKVTPSQGTVAPTGQVTFFNGSTTLGIVALGANGGATFQTSFTSAGVDTITAMYGGSGTYAPSTSSPLTETVVTPQVNATVSPTSLTIQSGNSGQLVITVTPVGGYTGTITFSCGALPPHVSCAFNPPSLTITANSGPLTDTLTVSTGTTQTASTFELRPGSGITPTSLFATATLWFPSSLALLMVLLVSCNGRLAVLQRRNAWLVATLCIVCVVALASCGSATANKAVPGTYKIPVTLSVQGQAAQNINATIIVQ